MSEFCHFHHYASIYKMRACVTLPSLHCKIIQKSKAVKSFTLEQAIKAQSRSSVIALLIL